MVRDVLSARPAGVCMPDRRSSMLDAHNPVFVAIQEIVFRLANDCE
jgi:hypothetical protein